MYDKGQNEAGPKAKVDAEDFLATAGFKKLNFYFHCERKITKKFSTLFYFQLNFKFTFVIKIVFLFYSNFKILKR